MSAAFRAHSGLTSMFLKEAPSVFMLYAPTCTVVTVGDIFISYKNGGPFMFCPLSCEKKWHKLRKVCRIWQEVTVRWINHNVGATLYKTAELLNVNINTGS